MGSCSPAPPECVDCLQLLHLTLSSPSLHLGLSTSRSTSAPPGTIIPATPPGSLVSPAPPGTIVPATPPGSRVSPSPPFSCRSAYATDLWSFSWALSLHPFSSVRLLPSGSTSVLGRSSSVLWHPGSISSAHHCGTTLAFRFFGVNRSLRLHLGLYLHLSQSSPCFHLAFTPILHHGFSLLQLHHGPVFWFSWVLPGSFHHDVEGSPNYLDWHRAHTLALTRGLDLLLMSLLLLMCFLHFGLFFFFVCFVFFFLFFLWTFFP